MLKNNILNLLLATILFLYAGISYAAESPFVVTPLQKQVTLSPSQPETDLGVVITFPSQHYLRAAKTYVDVSASDNFIVGALQAPPTKNKFDVHEHAEVAIYVGESDKGEQEVKLYRSLSLNSNFTGSLQETIQLKVQFLGCSPKVCYLPKTQIFNVDVRVLGSLQNTKTANNWNFSEAIKKGFLIAFLLAFLGGLVSSLTPCVYPMIPITIAVIGAKQTSSRLKSLKIGATFALGLALTYAVLGVIAASTGSLLGAALQSRGVVLFVVAVFMIMGLGLMGAFNVSLPPFINRLIAKSDQGTGVIGVMATGMVTGIVAAPCVGPVILSILTYVATTGNNVLGFGLLFFFALGLSTPFVVLGVFSSILQNLPRSGSWLEFVKRFFGILLIGVGFYYLKPLIAPILFNIMVTLTLFIFAFVVRLKLLFGPKGSLLVFAASFILASAFLFGGVFGTFSQNYINQEHSEGKIKWYSDLKEAYIQADVNKMPIMVDFYAEWCAACVELDEKTFSSDHVAENAKNFINVKLDFTRLDEEKEKLMIQYHVLALPAVLFFTSDGQQISDARIDGFVPPANMLKIQEHVLDIQKQSIGD